MFTRPDLTRALKAETPLAMWLRFMGAAVVMAPVSLALLHPRLVDLLRLVALGVGVAALGVSGARAFRRRPGLATLWPVLVSLVGTGLAGTLTDGLAPAFGGFYIVIFVYVGLTQPAWTTTKLLPLASLCWLSTNAPVDKATLARLPVALGVWALVGELLSNVASRNAVDRALLVRHATFDPLTGLLNRNGIGRRLAALDSGDSVVFLDLDHFKAVNDTCGHEAGDRVLADLGRVVTAVLRPGDVAIRYGGEEFLLLLAKAGDAGADRCIERLRQGWAASHPEMTFSAGVAVVREDAAAAALRHADHALYRAKAAGRNCTVHAGGDVPAAARPPAAVPVRA